MNGFSVRLPFLGVVSDIFLLGSHGLRDSGPGTSRVSHQRRSCPAENEPIPELKGISAVNPQPVGGLEPWNFMTFPSYWEFHHPN